MEGTDRHRDNRHGRDTRRLQPRSRSAGIEDGGHRARTGWAGDGGVSTPALWLLAPRGCTHQPGAARCPRRLHGSPSTPASGAAPASVRFPRWVSHCALLPPSAPLAALRSHGLARRGRGGGTRAGPGGRGRMERGGPGGLCRSQPPTGVSHLPHGQIRGRGRWGAGGNRAEEGEAFTAVGLGTGVLIHPHLVSSWHSHTDNGVHTPTYPAEVQAPCCPVSHAELLQDTHAILQDTTAPMAVLRGESLRGMLG